MQQVSSISKDIDKVNMNEQDNNSCLNDLPGMLASFEQGMDDMPKYVWTNGYEGYTEEELIINKMLRYILIDFYLNCMTKTDNKTTNERTPFCQHLIPILKSFSGVNGLIDFTWCEKGLLNKRLLSLCLPKPMVFCSLLDGVGISAKDNMERLLIESSGNDDGHTEEDTLKQISNTTNCLVMELKKYKLASYDTFFKRQTFGIHFIDTDIDSSEFAPNRYAFIEVVELPLKLKHDLVDQEHVTEEQNGFGVVARTVKDTVLSNTANRESSTSPSIKSRGEATNHHSTSRDLIRLGVFSKNAIDVGNRKGVLTFQAVGNQVVFYMTRLLSDGLYVKMEIGEIEVPRALSTS
ncbi:unnamed protein product [Absidia cylindrospora]